MSRRQLEECIALGEDIKEGRVDLLELDRRSLEVRGKLGRRKGRGEKRKRGGDNQIGDVAVAKKRGKPLSGAHKHRTSLSPGIRNTQKRRRERGADE